MSQLQLFFNIRQPIFIPYHLVKTWILKRKIRNIKKPKEIFISLTFDLENNWGNEEQSCQDENIKFIELIQDIIKSKATYFITAKLISVLSAGLKQLAKRNEIGLHGYRHELWKPAYFVEKKAVKDEEKRALLENSIIEFQKSGLDRPFSFRAPYMWCKVADIKLLERMGFKVDSSDRSQNGMFQLRKEDNMVRIPVSANPFPYYKTKKGLIFSKFRLFNLKTFNELNDAELFSFINQVLVVQKYKKSIPHLVFIAHPWEFYGNGELEPDENFNHRGPENYHVLKEKLRLIEEQFIVKYLTVSELKELFEKGL